MRARGDTVTRHLQRVRYHCPHLSPGRQQLLHVRRHARILRAGEARAGDDRVGDPALPLTGQRSQVVVRMLGLPAHVGAQAGESLEHLALLLGVALAETEPGLRRAAMKTIDLEPQLVAGDAGGEVGVGADDVHQVPAAGDVVDDRDLGNTAEAGRIEFQVGSDLFGWLVWAISQ